MLSLFGTLLLVRTCSRVTHRGPYSGHTQLCLWGYLVLYCYPFLQGYSTLILHPFPLPLLCFWWQPFLQSYVLASPSLSSSLAQLLSLCSEVSQPLLPSAPQFSRLSALIPGRIFLKSLLQHYTNLGLPPPYSEVTQRLEELLSTLTCSILVARLVWWVLSGDSGGSWPYSTFTQRLRRP